MNGYTKAMRLSDAVNRFLGCDRRSMVAIVESKAFTPAELENARDCARYYRVPFAKIVSDAMWACICEVRS